MSDLPEAAADLQLDPREAQDRLAEEFSAEIEADEEYAEIDAEDHDGADTVVTLDETAEVEATDNPFLRESALATAMRKIEALLFASPTPLSEAALEQRVPGADIPQALEKLESHYRNRGVNLRRVDKKWQFVTAPDVADVLVEHREQSKKLSRAALETLAIISYHQPCTRAEIEEVRGVAVAKGSLDQLLEMGWVRLRGKRDTPGRPVLYGTTPAFLEHFGLADISHLPGMSDLKAAGLLEARLPPGFEVPTPKGDDDDVEGPELSEDADFATDFHDDEASEAAAEEATVELDEPDDDLGDAFPEPDDEPF